MTTPKFHRAGMVFSLACRGFWVLCQALQHQLVKAQIDALLRHAWTGCKNIHIGTPEALSRPLLAAASNLHESCSSLRSCDWALCAAQQGQIIAARFNARAQGPRWRHV